jgi:hypothetical protein
MANQIIELPQGQTIAAMAEIVSKSGFFGNITPAAAGALLMIAQAEGKHPMLAMQEYDIVNNKPALKSTAIHSRFHDAGGKMTYKTSNEKECVVIAEIDGGQIEVKWTIERAKAAGMVKNVWLAHPQQMLRARAVAEAVRAIAPWCLSGSYSVEEMQEIEYKEPAPKATPVQSTQIEVETVEDNPSGELSPTVIEEIRACKTIPEIGATLKKYKEMYNIELLSAAGTAQKQMILNGQANKGGQQ